MNISKIINIIEASPMNQYLIKKEFDFDRTEFSLGLDFVMKSKHVTCRIKARDSKVESTAITTIFDSFISLAEALQEAAFYSAVLNLVQQILPCFDQGN